MREFFKPTKKKLITTILIFVVGLLSIIPTIMCSYGGPQICLFIRYLGYIHYAVFFVGYVLHPIYYPILRSLNIIGVPDPITIILTVLWVYLLTCIVNWLIKIIKEKKAR